MKSYFQVLSKYAVFEGRARRKEYWAFVLWNLIIAFCFGAIEGLIGGATNTNQSVFGTIYQLAVLVPSIAVGVRRMHDTNHRGWWLLVPIASFVLALREGDHGLNQYGPDPKAVPESALAGALAGEAALSAVDARQ